MEESNKSIADNIKLLPKDWQEYLETGNWKSQITEIILKSGIIDEQKKYILESEIVLVIAGLDTPDNFKENITREVGISEWDANRISREAEDTIFIYIRKFLEDMEVKKGDEVSQVKIEARSENHWLEEEIDKDDIMNEIENPMSESKRRSLTPEEETISMIDKKLSSIVKLPKDAVLNPRSEAFLGGNQNKVEIPRYTGEDPYREPLN